MDDLAFNDYLALSFFIIITLGYDWLINNSPLKDKHIFVGVQQQRHKWMNMMLQRDNRIVDTTILTTLSQGNAFFASTAIVIVGALATSLGSSKEIAAMLNQFPIPSENSPQMIKLKITFMMIVFLIAFFRFAWAFRLTHYTSIMVGATPLNFEPENEATKDHIERTIKLAGLAGKHANGGLHTYYYGIAAAGWLINPIVFIGSTTLIILILYRREFLSKSHALLTPIPDKNNTD